MRSLKSQATRLALYISAAGETPTASGEDYPERIKSLMGQFQRLSAEQRKEAKRLSLIRIRECGGLDAAAGDLVPVPAKVLRHQIRLQKRREKANQWPPESPACPNCKVHGLNIPKRSWPSREVAEVVRLSLGDPLLVTYACPSQPVCFHLGHKRTHKLNPNIKQSQEGAI